MQPVRARPRPPATGTAGYSLDIERVRRLFDGETPEMLRPLLEPEIATSRVAAMPGDRLMRYRPTLGDLAATVGLSEKRLNAGFRAMFGATVFEYLRNERLEQARLALETGDVSIKEIAFRVGYNHATNFTNAFAARYGVPPYWYVERGGRGRVRPSTRSG